MGSGGSKAHQAFTITPAPAAPAPADDDETDQSDEPDVTAPVDDPPEERPTATADPAAQGEVAGEWTDGEVLTPLPEQLDSGDVVGVALAVGGADLADGSATLLAYRDSTNPDVAHEVLCCTLSADAEDKLLDALIPPTTPKVPALVTTTIDGRLPVDTDNQLHEQLARVAKSINHHLADGTAIPEHTHTRLAEVTAQLDGLAATTDAGSTDAEMLAFYQAAAADCAQRCAAGFAVDYNAGGKAPMINPYEHHGTATITQLVPDPNFIGDGLNTKSRNASRIGATLAGNVATWDGTSRKKASGTELVIDLGDGYKAVFRPASMNPAGSSDASLHNTLEITAPPGSGRHHELVDRLGRLNIVNRPMTRTEAEWAYLERNVYAHQLESHPAVTTALANAAGIEDAHEQALLVARGHQAVGLDDTALASFARQLRLDAEAAALADKVRLVRDGVGQALGHNDGAALAATVGYNPTPERRRGWLTWGRIGQNSATVNAALKGRSLTHHITGHNLVEVVMSGVLAANERRRLMGIHHSYGMSEAADQKSGGARSVFLRVRKSVSGPGGGHLVWDDPGRLLSRTDWYGYDGDHFGAAIAGTGHSIGGQTRDPAKFAGFTAGNNEVMIAHGLDLFGADAPTRIICNSKTERSELISRLTAAGITHLGDKPLQDVIS